MTSSSDTPSARFSIALLENSQNELLFLKRASTSSLGPNQWGFPAGHIEANESPTNCARREIAEEIGAGHVLQLKRSHPPVRDLFYGGQYEVHLFHFLWEQGNIQLNAEHSEFRWVNKAELKTLDTMLGIDEDIHYLGIWPDEYLRAEYLPKKQ
ncbi:MAG: NUDIX hydrolase [Pseudomonadota bacterium]